MRSSFCVVCGQYTPYVALGEGTTTLFEEFKIGMPSIVSKDKLTHTRTAIVRVVNGDPICLAHDIRESKNPNKLVRYAKVEKLEPNSYLIDGVNARG